MARSLIGILVAAFVVGTQSTCAFADTLANKGIQAYNSRDYAAALSTLEQAKQMSPKDARVHYYLALTCQALNRTAEAEKEYRWTSEQSKDRDLKAKAALGLQNLLNAPSRAIATRHVSSSTPRAAAVSETPPGWLPPGSTAYKAERVAAPKSEQSFTRGCFKH